MNLFSDTNPLSKGLDFSFSDKMSEVFQTMTNAKEANLRDSKISRILNQRFDVLAQHVNEK